RFGPTFDDSSDWKSRRLAPLEGTIKLGPIDQRSAVIYRYSITHLWLRAVSFLEHFVLQTASGCLYGLFCFVFGQEFFARGRIFLRLLRLFLLHIFFKRRHSFSDFLFR